MAPDPLQVDERRWTLANGNAPDYNWIDGPPTSDGDTVEVVPASVVAARDEEIARLKAALDHASGRAHDARKRETERVAALTEEVERLTRANGGLLDALARRDETEDSLRRERDDFRDLAGGDMADALRTAEAEVARLSARTHEIAAEGDRKNAALESEIAKYRARYTAARERVKYWPVDWTDDPPSREPGGWWRYTSQNHIDEVVAVVESARAEGARQERKRLEGRAAAECGARAIWEHHLRVGVDPANALPWDELGVAKSATFVAEMEIALAAVLSSEEGT